MGWVPAHSLIFAGKNKAGEKVYYNAPGRARDKYDITPLHGKEGDTYQIAGWRFAGNLPEYEKKLEAAREALRTSKMPMAQSLPPSQVPSNVEEAMLMQGDWRETPDEGIASAVK